MKESTKLKVLMLSSEVSPYAKTGGLADVAGSLPLALVKKNCDIRIAMPRYSFIDAEMTYVTDFPVDMDGRQDTCVVKTAILTDGAHKTEVPVYFLGNYHYFGRFSVYSGLDEAQRFIFFCKAALEMLPAIGFQPDIIHCNDWHTGPVCMLMKEKYSTRDFYRKMKTIFTIHNLEYQGHFSKEVLRILGFHDGYFTADQAEFYGGFNFMKAGIRYADLISTVSEAYRKEIMTPEYGERLDGLLIRRQKDLYGILNGIPIDIFNPEKDPTIPYNYSKKNIDKKSLNKASLQKEMGLPVKDVPVLGMVSRLSSQKGLNLLLVKMDELLQEDIQLVLLGAGDRYYEEAFKRIGEKYPEKFAAHLRYHPTLAQRIYAGSDIFLMPSRYEPCGLGQMISLRYGTIPVVRQTGGLADTIVDYGRDRSRCNGFVFKDFESTAFMEAVKEALHVYRNQPEEWSSIMKRGMAQDYSWKRSSVKYLDLYMKAMAEATNEEVDSHKDGNEEK